MTISQWPAEERPREKLLMRGATALSDAELLAIFLRTGIPGRSAVALARDLLVKYGGLRQLLTSGYDSFCANRGVGGAKYAQLQAALEIGRRHQWEALTRETALTSPEQTRHYLQARLSDHLKEVFAVIFLDNRHRVIAYEELFHGTIHSASVHPREVVRRVLHYNAAAIIIAHNHPSGIAEPSEADRQITLRLREALALVDTRLIDHVVVSAGSCTSMAERGML